MRQELHPADETYSAYTNLTHDVQDGGHAVEAQEEEEPARAPGHQRVQPNYGGRAMWRGFEEI